MHSVNKTHMPMDCFYVSANLISITLIPVLNRVSSFPVDAHNFCLQQYELSDKTLHHTKKLNNPT